jgi:hypothetical protein
LLEQASAHAAPCAPPEYHSLTSRSAIGTCSMWAARLILLAQFVVERDGRVDAFLVDGLSQNTSQLPGLRQTVMTGDTLHLERRRLSRRQLADVIVVDGCDHLQHDASSLLPCRRRRSPSRTSWRLVFPHGSRHSQTFRANAKPRMVDSNCLREMSFGRTCKFVNFSGNCAAAGTAQNMIPSSAMRCKSS